MRNASGSVWRADRRIGPYCETLRTGLQAASTTLASRWPGRKLLPEPLGKLSRYAPRVRPGLNRAAPRARHGRHSARGCPAVPADPPVPTGHDRVIGKHFTGRVGASSPGLASSAQKPLASGAAPSCPNIFAGLVNSGPQYRTSHLKSVRAMGAAEPDVARHLTTWPPRAASLGCVFGYLGRTGS